MPSEKIKKQANEITMDFIKTKLAEKPVKENIKQRALGGKTFSYLEGWYIKQKANEIFGVGNWGVKCVWEQMKHTQFTIGKRQDGSQYARGQYAVPVEITVNLPNKVVVTHADIGVTAYNGETNVETAIKGCVTDGMKRAFSHFGNSFGLSLYSGEEDSIQPLTPSGNAGSKNSTPTPNPNQVAPTCKACGSPMSLRTGKFGQFWGCNGYPNCKTTYQTNEVAKDGSYNPKKQDNDPQQDDSLEQKVNVEDIPF